MSEPQKVEVVNQPMFHNVWLILVVYLLAEIALELGTIITLLRNKP
jgi:hypothetical protein